MWLNKFLNYCVVNDSHISIYKVLQRKLMHKQIRISLNIGYIFAETETCCVVIVLNVIKRIICELHK